MSASQDESALVQATVSRFWPRPIVAATPWPAAWPPFSSYCLSVFRHDTAMTASQVPHAQLKQRSTARFWQCPIIVAALQAGAALCLQQAQLDDWLRPKSRYKLLDHGCAQRHIYRKASLFCTVSILVWSMPKSRLGRQASRAVRPSR
jgi:hypothetical protein